MSKMIISALFLITTLLLGTIPFVGIANAQEPQFLFKINSVGTVSFGIPSDAAVDSSGNIYVTGNNQINVFDSSRNSLFTFGSFCRIASGDGCVDPDGAGPLQLGDGQFNGPTLIAVDNTIGSTNGNIIVADGNQRVQVFDSSGNFLFKITTFGINNPRGVAVDSSGNIIVAEPGKHRITVFDSSGNFVFMFGFGVDDGTSVFQICTSSCQAGILGAGDGQFRGPRGVAVDSSDRIIVADRSNNRIQVFDSSGTFIKKFGPIVDGAEPILEPPDVAVDRITDNIIVPTTFRGIASNLLQVFDSSGNFLFKLGGTPAGFQNPRGVGVDNTNGNILLSDATQDEILIFNSLGDYLFSIALSQNSFRPNSIAVDSSDRILVADPGPNHRVLVMDSSGNFLFHIDLFGSGDGQIKSPEGVAVDSSDRIIVYDRSNNKVQVFDSAGNFLFNFGSFCRLSPVLGCSDPDGPGPLEFGDGQFSATFLIRVAADRITDNIIVSDHGNSRIQVFDSAGNFLSKSGFINGPVGVAVDSSGRILVAVASSGNHRIQVLDSAGNFLFNFGSSGSGDGQFFFPRGVAVDSSDNIYVADTENNRIQGFDSSGNFLFKLGSFCKISTGSGCVDPDGAGPLQLGDGQFERPSSIAVDNSNRIIVADRFNQRIQVFQGDTTPPETSITSSIDGNLDVVTNGGSTVSDSMTLTFDGTDDVDVASFECSLDGASFSACTTPQGFTTLALGSHTFQVRAIDTSGNTDPTPASLSWDIFSQIISSNTGGNVAAGPGDTVLVSNNAQVGGNIEADGGVVTISGGSTVAGNIEAGNGAAIVIEDGSTVEGNVSILVSGAGSTLEINGSNVDGNIEVQDIDSLIITNTVFGGNIFSINSGILTITDNTVNGDINSQNDGQVTITGNVVNGNVEITSPASCTESGNSVNGNNSGCP